MSEPGRSDLLAEVVRKIAPHSRLARAWNLRGGISAEMIALELLEPDGAARKLILRRPGAAAQEFAVLRATRALGLAVPAPLALDSSGQLFPTPYLVIEYIEGEPDFAPADRQSFARQFAAQLAAIHRAGGSGADLSFLPAQPPDLDSCCGGSLTPPGDFWEAGPIHAVLARAWPFLRRNSHTLLHGDYWPGNVLWRAGRLAAVIDWEDAVQGDPLFDLATSRLDLLWILGLDIMEAFTRHYLSEIKVDTTALPLWDLVGALRLARLIGTDLDAWAAFFHPYGRFDITPQSILAAYRLFTQAALRSLAA